MKASLGLRVMVAAVLAGSAGPADAQTEPIDGAIEQIALGELRSHAASGGVIAVLAGDSVHVRAVGSTLHEGGHPVRADQPFGMVSFDDVLTAFAAVLLDAGGRLDVDEPIRSYASDLPRRVGSVTLTQLLSHTAGLDDAEELAPRRRPVSKLWANATDGALFTEPGAIHSPSRVGTMLVQAIVEERAAQPAAAVVERLILGPASLARTTFDLDRAARLDAVPGYVVSTSGAAPLHALTPATNPMPQLYASAGDIARLLRLWLSGGEAGGTRVWPADAVAAMLAARAPRPSQPGDSVTFGLTVSRRSGRRELSYAAGEAGYGILVRLVPEARSGVVVLANATGALLRRTAAAVLDGVLPEELEAEPMPADRTELAADPAAYAGTYANGDRMVVLELREGVLHWRDGDLMLPVRREGAVLEAYVADGRVAQRFRWTRDAAGHAYVLVGERAFRRTDVR